MSKSKKTSKVKPAKKSTVKKPVKKVNKSVAKSSSSPKKSSTPAKKASKPVPKKPAKALKAKPVKKPVAAPAKKAVKATKPSKPVKVSKPVKTAAKTTQVPAPKKPVAAPAPKKPAANTPPPTVKKPAPAPAPAKKPEPAPKKEAPVTAKVAKQATEAAETKHSDKKGQEVLAITNTIPVLEKTEISASRIASISHSITNPIKRPESYSVRVEKEPPGKFEMEFVVHASAEMLFEFLSTPSGLSEWFCDDLNIRNGIYTFIWEDTMQQARLLKTIELQLVRFQWVDKTDGSYFEFRIQRDDLTNDISLIITDFAESNGDRESSKLLWSNQIEKLMHVIGSVF